MNDLKYEYEYKDTSIKWRRHGKGYLEIGVGGPVAAREIAHLLDELNEHKAELEAKDKRIRTLEGELYEYRKAIVQTSIDLTNVVKNTPYRNLDDAISFRSVVCGAALKIHKRFKAALGSGEAKS